MKKIALVMLPILILVSVGYAMTASVIVSGDTTPPIINILSPQNTTYYANTTPLTFTLSEPTSWIGYSLDGAATKTIAGNIVMNVTDGPHNVIISANDTSGNMGSSQRIYFTSNQNKYLPWETSYVGQGGYPIIDIEAYNGKLYFVSNFNHMYIFDGNGWSMTQTPVTVPTLKSNGDKLYVAGSPGYIYSFNGSSWSPNPVLDIYNGYVNRFNVSRYIKMLGNNSNRLYAGTYLAPVYQGDRATLYYCDSSCDNPSNWHNDTNFASIFPCSLPFCSIDTMEVYNNKVYLTSGGTIYTYNGAWSKLIDLSQTMNVSSILDMKVYNNKLYLATSDSPSRCPADKGYSGFCGRVIEYNGTNWRTVFDHIGTNTRDGYQMYSLEVYDGRLYAGTADRIYMTSDGTNWQLTFDSSDSVQYALVMKAWNNKIYVGFGNGVMFKDDFVNPINITFISPLNNTAYSKVNVTLNFTISDSFNKPISWIGYSLNKAPNVTISKPVNLTSLPNGWNNVTLSANDTAGYKSSSFVKFFYCLGDVNGDRTIDMMDLALVARLNSCRSNQTCYNSTTNGILNSNVDLNSDGVIDTKDIGIVSGQFGNSC